MNHEYLGIDGLPAFTSASARLILGEQSPAITEGRTVTVQSLSVRTNRLIQFSSVPYPTIERTNPEKDGRIISQSIFAELPSHRLDASVFFFFARTCKHITGNRRSSNWDGVPRKVLPSRRTGIHPGSIVADPCHDCPPRGSRHRSQVPVRIRDTLLFPFHRSSVHLCLR